jgi:hypothetical protein
MNLSSNYQTEGLTEAISFLSGQSLAAEKIQGTSGSTDSPVRVRPSLVRPDAPKSFTEIFILL